MVILGLAIVSEFVHLVLTGRLRSYILVITILSLGQVQKIEKWKAILHLTALQTRIHVKHSGRFGTVSVIGLLSFPKYSTNTHILKPSFDTKIISLPLSYLFQRFTKTAQF